MPYIKKTWSTGEVITAADLNNMEQGIADLDEELGSIDSELEDTFARVDGYYDELTAGNAEQLVSTVGVNDKTPYLFRTTGGSADVGDRVKLSEITGGTVAWNQLYPTPTTTPGDTEPFSVGTTFRANGKYLAVFNGGKVDADGAKPSIWIYVGKGSGMQKRVNAGSSTVFNCTVSVTADGTKNDNANSCWIYKVNGSNLSFQSFCVFDLTAMFGSTIADYIYSLEQNTAGAGVAWFRKLFPKDYYAYDAGSLLSVKTSAHKMVGFNQFDADNATLYLAYLAHTAADVYDWVQLSDSRSFAVRCLPNTTYCVYLRGASPTILRVGAITTDSLPSTPTSGGWSVRLEKEFVNIVSGQNKVLYTTGNNATYLIVQLGSLLVPTRLSDLCINLSWDGEKDGTYEPYEVNTYQLDDVELRGIPKLDANNNLYYDGDGYAPDGTVTRRFITISISAAQSKYGTWDSDTGKGAYWYTTLEGLSLPGIKGLNTAFIKGFVFDSNVSANTAYTSPTITIYANGIIRWVDPSHMADDKATYNAYLANNPIVGVYELATPTTESAEPYTETQICNDFGTEEFVDSRTVPMPVGASALYQANLRAKLEMAPDSPDGDGDYIVRQTDGLNEYVLLKKELPTAPAEDGTYSLKCIVADGVSALTWVEDT